MVSFEDSFPFIALVAAIVFWIIPTTRVLRVKCPNCDHRNGKRFGTCSECEADLFNPELNRVELLFDRNTILLSFFFPPVAWYLYYYTRNVFPEKSNTLLTLSVISPFILAYNLLGVFHAGNELI